MLSLQTIAIAEILLALTQEGMPRPRLPVIFHNPHTGDSFQTWALVDTGADMCVIPADFAPLLGHTLEAGFPDVITGASGPNTTYSHTTCISILHATQNEDLVIPGTEVVHSIFVGQFHYSPGLGTVLLGARSFLGAFVLNVDYPKAVFSIKAPAA